MTGLPHPLALLLALALALAGCEDGRPPLTTDRVSSERLESLASGPMALVRRGDLRAGEAELAAMVARIRARRGVGSLDEYDLLMGFALSLNSAEKPGEAQTWFRQAAAASIRTFGPSHPETAVALDTYADVIDGEWKHPPPPQAVSLTQHALAIRRATLGKRHPETLATIAALSEMHVRVVRASGDRSSAQKAEALIDELLEHGEGPEPYHFEPHRLRRNLATLYAATGRADALIRLIEEDEHRERMRSSAGWFGAAGLLWRKSADLIEGHWPGKRTAPGTACNPALGMLWSEELALLEKKGFRREAAAIRKRGCPDGGST